jgi:hypothetical protein
MRMMCTPCNDTNRPVFLELKYELRKPDDDDGYHSYVRFYQCPVCKALVIED